MKAADVANYFIHRALQEGDDEGITNLKIQKLCYYAQGFHLAMNNGTALFDEPIEAWKHGPVVRNLYVALASNGANPIPTMLPPNYDISKINENMRAFLDDIYNEFGQFSAWALRNMTHKEDPWLKNWDDSKDTGGEISHNDLKTYFASKLSA